MDASAEKPSGEMKVARAIAGMEGGDGEFSYTRNSRLQSRCINVLKPILEQEIQELSKRISKPGSTIRVADFGCSVGANALQYAEICYRSVQASRNNPSSPAVPVQYYFCDLPTNDFNTLFRQLEDWRNHDSTIGEEFYAAAVPGSFYGSLFPPGSLHVAISVLAVQWMSQVPNAVVDSGSPAYNKGRVWIDQSKNVAAVKAFAQVARQDLSKYLELRAQEVASGGLVVLYIPGRIEEQHPEIQWPQEEEYASPFGKVFEATWDELILEDIIKEERRDSFNIPVYFRSLGEVTAVVESTNNFHIKRLKIQRQSFFESSEVEEILADPEAYGQFARKLLQSAISSFVVEHFGHNNLCHFFDRLEQNATIAAQEKRIPNLSMDYILVVLIRK